MSRPRAAGAIIDINLLPASRRPADVSPLAATVAVVFVVAILGIVPLSLRASDARRDAAAMHDRARAAEQQVDALQVDLATVRGLRLELADTQAKQKAIEEELADLRGGTRPLADDLSRIWNTAASHPSLQVKRAADAATGVSVTGNAPDPLAAIAYARALIEAGFASASMTTFAPAGDGAGQFTIEVTR
jgi:hypothetical protein